MKKPRPSRPEQPWDIQAKDFTRKRYYAPQDWRFLMIFEYLRISPSYALALNTNEIELIKQLGDEQRARAVWQTRCDMGDVHHMLYKEWWLKIGIGLFGVHTSKPRIEVINRIRHGEKKSLILSNSQLGLEQYLENRYRQQGRPDSLLLSIPFGLNQTTTVKQLKKLLTEMETQAPPNPPPAPMYELENNKMRRRRLLHGLRLIYMRAAKPKEELWRIATRAKISHSHGRLDPLAAKKDNTNPDARRMLTIMASRLLHDTLVVAENAAMGVFPSLAPINTDLFDAAKLKTQLADTMKWEKKRKAELLELAKAAED
jgi:hypothetical protein